ncbi:MAG: hypothetical protein IT393_06810 [Nitrospirae bacterium]|nr:hypothetical protein [Nitrospirota bacterium]
MKYSEFKAKIQNFPVFSSSHLPALGGNEKLLRNQISSWKKKGLMLELRKGLYVLNESDRKIALSRPFLANQVYSPSYVSTEYALGFYDLIPERVADVTSVTTRKTASFENPFGLFLYQHVGIPCFGGFIERKDENGLPFMIAAPEKAVIDFLYLNLARFEPGQPEVFETSFRFQNLDQLDLGYMDTLTPVFHSKKLMRIVAMLVKFIKGG